MSIINDETLWEDDDDATPPPQWEALASDSRWWWFWDAPEFHTGTINYIGPDPLPSSLIFNYEVVNPNTAFLIYRFLPSGIYTGVSIPDEVTTGQITVNIPDGTTYFEWGVSNQQTSSHDFYGQVAIDGEDPVVVEPEPEPVIEDIYYRVKYKCVTDFVNLVNARNPNADNVVVAEYGPDNIRMTIRTDHPPTYWTSIDDEYIVFDSYDSTQDDTIVPNKTEVYVSKSPSLVIDDTTLIELPANLMQYLYAQAESACFAYFKQQPNPKAEQREHRQRIRSQRSKWRHQRMKYPGPDYGRR